MITKLDLRTGEASREPQMSGRWSSKYEAYSSFSLPPSVALVRLQTLSLRVGTMLVATLGLVWACGSRTDSSTSESTLVANEGRGVLPEGFAGLTLNDSERTVRAARGALTQVTADLAGIRTFEERIDGGARVRYRFAEDALVELQILSMLPAVDAVPQHLAAMNERYGRPTRILDCSEPRAYPSRRFLWDKRHVAIADSFLVAGDRVSVTWTLMSRARMFGVLERGRCHTIRESELERFPVAR